MADNISSYDPGLPAIRPSEVGVEATASAAYRINRAYTELGASEEQTGRQAGQDISGGIKATGQAIEDSMYHRELSHGVAQEAQVMDNLTAGLDKTLSDPTLNVHDPNLVANFQKNYVQPALDSFSNGFVTERGQDWAQRRGEAIQSHFNSLAVSETSLVAAKALHEDVTTASNGWQNTAARFPGMVPGLIQTAKDQIASLVSSSPNVKGADAANANITLFNDVKKQIVQAGFSGAVQHSSNPEGVVDYYSKAYPDVFSEKDNLAMAKEARMQLRLGQAADRADQAETRRQNLDKYHAAANDFELSLTKQDANGNLVPNTPPNVKQQLSNLAHMPNADPSRTSALIAKVEADGRQQDETTRANIEKTSEVTQARLFAEGADPAKINAEYADHEGKTLTWPARTQLINDYNADKSATGETLAKARDRFFNAYAASFGSKPSAQYAANQEARRQERVLQAKGQDPQSLYDDQSPNFFGKQMPSFWSSLWGEYSAPAPTAPAKAPAVVPEKDIPGLAPGTLYTAPDGTIRRRGSGPQVPMSQ